MQLKTVSKENLTLDHLQAIWVSIDGGGSKTRLCACNASGTKLYDSKFGCTNYKAADYSQVRHYLIFEIQKMLAALGCAPCNVVGMIMGISGCDTVKDIELYTNLMLETGIPIKRIYICNDTEVAYRALVDSPGVCVVAGTGSIVCAYNSNGLQDRVGGWGAPLSDLGSGYWIGASLLKHMIRWLDGLEIQSLPPYDILLSTYGKPRNQVAGILATLSVSEVAAIAPLVFRFAQSGDTTCQSIIQESVNHLVEQIITLCRRLHFEGELPIVTVGGLFQNSSFHSMVMKAVSDSLKPIQIRFLMPISSPAEDGLIFARKRFPHL